MSIEHFRTVQNKKQEKNATDRMPENGKEEKYHYYLVKEYNYGLMITITK